MLHPTIDSKNIGSIGRAAEGVLQYEEPPLISCFLFKVASRCNLNCDYCYVYQHADQNWKNLPKIISNHHIQLFAKRLAEYIAENALETVTIVFHGGEPLLAGVDKIVEIINRVKLECPKKTHFDFCLQTNGVLLNEKNLALLIDNSVSISLSLDGPQVVNDLHRLRHNKKSSFKGVENAFHLLKKFPKNFSGVISVIDPLTDPDLILSFFSELKPPSLDFLLPDANHVTPPKHRDLKPDIYEKWLIKAFDLWFDQYPDLPIRFFDTLLNSIAGLPSQTDAFGFGDISLLSIETDGSYHDLDVLKITNDKATALDLTMDNASISQAASSKKIEAHRRLLRLEGLSKTCKSCKVVDICGGGAVPHRYSSQGFSNPTVYCQEMIKLIEHAKAKIMQQIDSESKDRKSFMSIEEKSNFSVILYNDSDFSEGLAKKLISYQQEENLRKFKKILEKSEFRRIKSDISVPDEYLLKELVRLPSVSFWIRVMNNESPEEISQLVGDVPVREGMLYLPLILDMAKTRDFGKAHLHRADQWLRYPFKDIIFEPEKIVVDAKELIADAFELIDAYKPSLRREIDFFCPEIQLVQDPKSDCKNIISFSDESMLGAIYICLYQNKNLISSYNLADSIIHEYRHQKLYLLEKFLPLVAVNKPLVYSPWPKALRSPQSLFHALFVFSELLQFWEYLLKNNHTHAFIQVSSITEKMREGFNTLKECSLTKEGEMLLTLLIKKVNITDA